MPRGSLSPGWALYRQQQTAQRVAAAAARIQLAEDHGPHKYRHGWIPIDPDTGINPAKKTAPEIRYSPQMQKMLRGADFTSRPSAGGDTFLTEISKQQGFDAKPTLVSPDDLQKVIDAGQPEMFRGVETQHQVEAFKTGDLFSGEGMFGNGTYTLAVVKPGPGLSDSASTDVEQFGSAKLRMTLRPGAKLTNLDEVASGQDKDVAAHQRLIDLTQADIDNEKRAGAKRIASARKRNASIHEISDITRTNEQRQRALEDQLPPLEAWAKVIRDMGRWAALNGYDAIELEGEHWGDGRASVLVLNRGALLVDKDFT